LQEGPQVQVRNEFDAELFDLMHVINEEVSRKVHMMLQEQHGDEKMRGRQPKGVSARNVIIEPGLRVTRFNLAQPTHADPDIGGQLPLGYAMAPAAFFNTATRDRLDLGQYRRIFFRGVALI
jgi:hypothetical protein